MEPECMYFQSYFQVNKSGRKESYRGKEVREWCKQYDASVLRPIFRWTAQEVIDCILDAGQQPNPLYKKGFSRVGCFPCVMCRHREMLGIIKDESMKQRLIQVEKLVKKCHPSEPTFFSTGYIPNWACSNKTHPTVEDVFKYLSDKNATLDMFEPEDGYACMSMYHGLCE